MLNHDGSRSLFGQFAGFYAQRLPTDVGAYFFLHIISLIVSEANGSNLLPELSSPPIRAQLKLLTRTGEYHRFFQDSDSISAVI